MRTHKQVTLLNIGGLAIGLCVCILLFAFVSHELSFDRMYKNADNIYRVNMKMSPEYHGQIWAELPNAVGPALVDNIPEIKATTRLIKDDFGATASLKVGENNFVE
ncbi:MAG: ABC transporter permease, partial [Bacteroidota bacterium]|nr:ABC transporter permease [Bacteroidota bacterium]